MSESAHPGHAALAPWQERLLDRFDASHQSGRLGHALLITGPAHIGKLAVAEALSRRLLCTRPDHGRACGRCRSCVLAAAGTHPDFKRIGYEINDKTGKLRTELVIGQMRKLSEWFSLTPQLGGAQVAVVEPADALNHNAANALLKTLEEPLGNRYLVLVTAQAHRLVATIRSRCQRFELNLPGHDEALGWLAGQGVAAAALEAARGNPGLAVHWSRTGALKLREEVIAQLAGVASGRAGPLELAKAWSADEALDMRLRLAADHAQTLCAALQGIGPSAGLTPGMDFQKLSTWFDAANRLRTLLGSPIRTDLSVAGLLRDWRVACTGR